MSEKLTRGRWLMSLLAMAGFAQQKTKDVDTEELERLIKDEKNLFLLDVREAKELEEFGTLKGYVNIPIGELEKRLSEVPKDKAIVTL